MLLHIVTPQGIYFVIIIIFLITSLLFNGHKVHSSCVFIFYFIFIFILHVADVCNMLKLFDWKKYVEQVTRYLLMFLLSVRACSETAKQNSICWEIHFCRSLCLMKTSQFICVGNRLTGFFVIHEVQGFHLISGKRFQQVFGQVTSESAETLCFWLDFFRLRL